MDQMKNILVIDDSKLIRSLLRDVLTDNGYTVALASDGNHGYQEYIKNPTKVVIVDIFMPEKDGIEIIEEIKEFNENVKIIAISSDENEIYLSAAKTLGADHILKKPIDIKELLTFLDSVFN